MINAQEKYLIEHSSPQGEALDWLERQTNIRTNYPRMLSGAVQGRLLKMLVQMTGAKNILEIGCFTGYSSICMAQGLPEDGHIDTLEINDELEELIREAFERAGVADKISLMIGDAKQSLKSLKGKVYDLVYIDANKREYCEYYELVMELTKSGSVILADDVLWDGKLFQDPVPGDKQTQGLVRFNDMISKDHRVEAVILPLRDGLTIIRRK